MKFLYHIPSLYTISAGRPYYYGYKNACEDMGHEFRPLTADDNQEKLFDEYQPDIFMTGLSTYALRYLNLRLVKKHKKKGMKVFVNIPFWISPMSKLRINENPSLSENKEFVNLIKSGEYGDIYYNVCEPGDPRMDGFEQATSYQQHTLLLAADKTIPDQPFHKKYQADVSFIGSYLPGRRKFMQEQVFPLKRKYKLKLYMNDLTIWDRSFGFLMKVGQYFNIPYLRSLKKNNVTLEEEKRIFVSTLVCINFHEDFQREFGCDCNDRTFKIPLAGGFEVVDDVKCIRKYFKDEEEIVIAKDKKDWFEKIEYYIKNPDKRVSIIEMGKRRVLADHTYHNRVQQIMDIYKGR